MPACWTPDALFLPDRVSPGPREIHKAYTRVSLPPSFPTVLFPLATMPCVCVCVGGVLTVYSKPPQIYKEVNLFEAILCSIVHL